MTDMIDYYVCNIKGCDCLLERGHSTIKGLGALQFYSDGSRIAASYCGHCGRGNTSEDHDGCLGILTGGVMNACCGHGTTKEAYVQFWDGLTVDGQWERLWLGGQEAIDYIKTHSPKGLNIGAYA